MNLIDDPLITDKEICRIFGGVSKMTVWRLRRSGILPPPIVINKRNYSRKSVINETMSRVVGYNHEAIA